MVITYLRRHKVIHSHRKSNFTTHNWRQQQLGAVLWINFSMQLCAMSIKAIKREKFYFFFSSSRVSPKKKSFMKKKTFNSLSIPHLLFIMLNVNIIITICTIKQQQRRHRSQSDLEKVHLLRFSHGRKINRCDLAIRHLTRVCLEKI